VLKNLLGTKATIKYSDSKGPREDNVNVNLTKTKIIAVDEADEVYNIDNHANAMGNLV